MSSNEESFFEELFEDNLHELVGDMLREKSMMYSKLLQEDRDAFQKGMNPIKEKISKAISETLTIEERLKLKVFLSERRYSTNLQRAIYEILDKIKVKVGKTIDKDLIDKIKAELSDSQIGIENGKRLTISDKQIRRLLKQYGIDKQ